MIHLLTTKIREQLKKKETLFTNPSVQGHANPINSVCWDPSGDFLATVSEDMVKVWTLGTGSEGECVHELSCNGNKFQSCVFHPTYPSLLVIGCYQVKLIDIITNVLNKKVSF